MSTPASLFEAIKSGDLAKVEALIRDEPALVQSTHAGGLTPLMLATYYRQESIASALIEHGATVDLFVAAARGDTDRLHVLLAENAELVHTLSADGWTPLHLAAQSGSVPLVELVLAHRPFVDPENEEGVTPLALARAEGHQDVIKLLERHSAEQL